MNRTNQTVLSIEDLPADRLAMKAIDTLTEVLGHLTLVVSNHVDDYFAFRLSNEVATDLVGRIRSLTEMIGSVLKPIIAGDDSENIRANLHKHLLVWLVNIEELEPIIADHPAWRGKVDGWRASFEQMVNLASATETNEK